MFNRIAQYNSRFGTAQHAFQTAASFSTQPMAISHLAQFQGAQFQGARPQGGMMVVPMMIGQAHFQAQLYRLAYEQALADLAPPRHHRRFFSVWN
jgi:hypothetical protein